METFNYSEVCIRCNGYKTMPYATTSTAPLKMCNCGPTLGWECPRCHKINAPFKKSCNCLPFNPMGAIPYIKANNASSHEDL